MAKRARRNVRCEEDTTLNPEVFQPGLLMQEKARRPAESLTAREKTIAAHVALGLSNAEIAGDLKISIQTVKNHLGSIFDKVGVTSRLELATWLFNHDCRLCPLRSPSGVPQPQKRSTTEPALSIPASSNPWRVT